ncbi:MAG TPA: hypothetical protein VMT18_14895 [Planctomycetota bacterium]|nr:hypothetical protein [Planctomycetota bacterium]
MLLRREQLEAIATGRLRRVYRRWRRPTVRAGGSLRTAVGVLAIDAVERVAAADISAADARRAGYASPAALLAELAGRAGSLYRIDLRLLGADPRIALRGRARMSAEEFAELTSRLARLDRATPWTRAVLRAIEESPGVLAAELALGLRTPKDLFKRRVRRLKELGLTESLDTGYRISPRGKALLRRLRGSARA